MDPELETSLKEAYADAPPDAIRADLEASRFAGMVDIDLLVAYVASVANS